jgi:hypothetical protein
MSDDQPNVDLMDRLARVDNKLEQLLESAALPTEPARSEVSQAPEAVSAPDPDGRVDSGSPPPSAPPAAPRPPKATISAGEVNSILQKVDDFNRDAEVMARLDRLERQNRKIVTLGSLFMTVMLLVLGASIFLVLQADLANKGAILTASNQAGPLQPLPGKAVAPSHGPQTPGPVAGVHGLMAPKPSAPAVEPKPNPPAVDPKPVAEKAAPKPAPAHAPVKYVGFITSNKYHYPSCKWAADINRYRHRTFSFVKEALAMGYIPCPTCHPPSHD